MHKRAFIMLAITSGCHSPSFTASALFSRELRDKMLSIQILLNFHPYTVFYLFTVNNLLLFTSIATMLISLQSRRCGEHFDVLLALLPLATATGILPP